MTDPAVPALLVRHRVPSYTDVPDPLRNPGGGRWLYTIIFSDGRVADDDDLDLPSTDRTHVEDQLARQRTLDPAAVLGRAWLGPWTTIATRDEQAATRR